VVVPCASVQVSLKRRTSDSFNCRHRDLRVLLDTVRFNQYRLYHALDVTTRSAHLTQLGGRASQTVSPGSPVREYPPRKNTPKSTHARRRPGEGAPSDKHELCDRMFTCPRQRPRGDTHASPSYPIRSSRTLRKPSLDTLKGPSEKPPLTPSKDPRKTLPPGPTGPITRRTAEASNTALSRGGGRVLRDTLAAPRGQARGVT